MKKKIEKSLEYSEIVSHLTIIEFISLALGFEFIKYLNKLENNLISYKVLRTDIAVLDVCFFHLKE